MKKVFTKLKEIFWPEKVQTRNELKYPDLDENIRRLNSFVNEKGEEPTLEDLYCLIGCTARLLSDQDENYDHDKVKYLSKSVKLFLSLVACQFNAEHETNIIFESHFKNDYYVSQDLCVDGALWIIFDIVSDNGRLRVGFRFSVNVTLMDQGFVINDEFRYSVEPVRAPYSYKNFYDCLFSHNNVNHLSDEIVPFKDIEKA